MLEHLVIAVLTGNSDRVQSFEFVRCPYGFRIPEELFDAEGPDGNDGEFVVEDRGA